MEFDYDLFVIGAGSGGVRAARMSAMYGANVAMAEEYRVGGTCVIRGCVPKKLFVYASHYAEDFHEAEGFGWTVGETQFDWGQLIKNKDLEIDRLNKIYIKNAKAAGVEIIEARAELIDRHTIAVEGRQVTAKYILLAPGATPFIPDIPGAEHAISSNEAFHLAELPEKIVIVGGGYIAVEFAGIFNGLGVDVTLVYRGDEIMRGFDADIRSHLRSEMVKKGITVLLNTDVSEIAEESNGYEIHLSDGQSLMAGQVMYATGRVPNVAGLGLDKAGVETHPNGAIKVDAYSQTSVDNIYAVGDVTDRAQLTPIAIREGAAFAQTVFNKSPQKVDHSIIPTAVFSQPPIGTVGMTEAAAREDYEIDVYRSVFRPMKHTLSGSEEKTLMKLLVDKKSDKVLGLHIVGPDSGEMIQAFGIAVTMGATKADFDATVAVHPTAAEELVTMKVPVEG